MSNAEKVIARTADAAAGFIAAGVAPERAVLDGSRGDDARVRHQPCRAGPVRRCAPEGVGVTARELEGADGLITIGVDEIVMQIDLEAGTVALSAPERDVLEEPMVVPWDVFRESLSAPETDRSGAPLQIVHSTLRGWGRAYLTVGSAMDPGRRNYYLTADTSRHTAWMNVTLNDAAALAQDPQAFAVLLALQTGVRR